MSLYRLKPLPGHALVKRVFPIRSQGGIHYAEKYAKADEKQVIVLAIGDPRPNEPIEFKVGDHVIIDMLGKDRQPVEDGLGRVIIDVAEVVAVVTPIEVHATGLAPSPSVAPLASSVGPAAGSPCSPAA